MVTSIGEIRGEPERRDGKWYFSIWNERGTMGINCVSSAAFETANPSGSLAIKPLDKVEVIGEVQPPGVICFHTLRNVKAAGMSTGRNNKLAGQIGEFLVCAELGRRPLANAPGGDMAGENLFYMKWATRFATYPVSWLRQYSGHKSLSSLVTV
jgi:hypothetical protein